MRRAPSAQELPLHQPLVRAIQEPPKPDEPVLGHPNLQEVENNQAFKSYRNEMTTFLDNQMDDSSPSSDEANVEINFENLHVPRVIDREDDVLEQEEVNVAMAPPEPFNLDELRISLPQLKFDTDEYYIQVLREKFGKACLERALAICKEYENVYLEDQKIVSQMVKTGFMPSEEKARELVCECSALLLIQSYQ